MSRYKFSSAQRYAIFLVHGMKCYMCRIPLDLTSMVVEHVLPEHLIKSPSLFNAAKSTLGLPASFDLNSFENWMPACSSCNGKKAALHFEPSLLIQVELQNLAKKADKARRLCDEVVSARQVSIALNVLEQAQESGRRFEESIWERLFVLLRFASARELVPKGQPLRLTQSFQLLTTTVEAATRWGATHWSIPPREPGEPALVVLFRAERRECVECGLITQVFQPINQEGGGDPICGVCLSNLDWMDPVTLGDLPTHVTQA
ncbi:hypothetical protein [Paraburkholderia dioscoreae]|uniref:HNH endonuclease n=1 Tax=Paraburkholderia dioscoreae TaxID=2604047 RepID=A0A5Q4Z737_9BURK|nr:hypothetical protein [Paraburkholderia dioscoreae]VVD26529.1 conserved protein of unknown function [Paraburkholderia dioscoreae]